MNTSPSADRIELQNSPRWVGQVDNILGRIVSVSAASLVLADLKGKGMTINTTNAELFRAKLRRANFYSEWHK